MIYHCENDKSDILAGCITNSGILLLGFGN